MGIKKVFLYWRFLYYLFLSLNDDHSWRLSIILQVYQYVDTCILLIRLFEGSSVISVKWIHLFVQDISDRVLHCKRKWTHKSRIYVPNLTITKWKWRNLKKKISLKRKREGPLVVYLSKGENMRRKVMVVSSYVDSDIIKSLLYVLQRYGRENFTWL